MTHPDYFEILASARRRPEQWRIFVILSVGLFVVLVGSPMFFLMLGSGAAETRAVAIGPRGELAVGVTPGGAFMVLASFVVMIAATLILASRLHDRGLRELTGPSARLRADFLSALKWGVPLTAITFLLPWDLAQIEVIDQYPLTEWLFWLPFALLGLMIQVTAEELFFRGYLQSQISGATGSVALGVLGSALCFGVGHVGNIGEGALFPVIWAMAFGILAGDLTVRTGSIGPAIALHLVNNAAAMLIAPHEQGLSGFGYMLRTGDLSLVYSDPKLMLFEFLHLLVLWLAVRVALCR